MLIFADLEVVSSMTEAERDEMATTIYNIARAKCILPEPGHRSGEQHEWTARILGLPDSVLSTDPAEGP